MGPSVSGCRRLIVQVSHQRDVCPSAGQSAHRAEFWREIGGLYDRVCPIGLPRAIHLAAVLLDTPHF